MINLLHLYKFINKFFIKVLAVLLVFKNSALHVIYRNKSVYLASILTIWIPNIGVSNVIKVV